MRILFKKISIFIFGFLLVPQLIQAQSLKEVPRFNIDNISSYSDFKVIDDNVFFFINSQQNFISKKSAWTFSFKNNKLSEIVTKEEDLALAVGSDPSEFVDAGSLVFFAIDGNIYAYNKGTKLTTLIHQFQGGALTDPLSTSIVDKLTRVGSKVFFIHKTEIWKIESSSLTVNRVLDLPKADGVPSEVVGEVFGYDGNFYFSYDEGENGAELWRSDGTESGTSLFLDIDKSDNCGGVPCGSNPHDFFIHNGLLIFDTQAAFNSGRSELWQTNGVDASSIGSFQGGSVQGITKLGVNHLVNTNSGSNINEIWSLNINSKNINRVKQLSPASSEISSFFLNQISKGDKIYFGILMTKPLGNGEINKFDLWESQGTSESTLIRYSITIPENAYSLNVGKLVPSNSGVYFNTSICLGGMMSLNCSTELKLFNDGEVQTAHIGLGLGAGVTYKGKFYVPKLVSKPTEPGSTLKLLTDAVRGKVNISGAIMLLFDEE